jgi:poly-gamma-glutamate synthesis protein (capsule biosynthesis protein)
MVDRQDLLAPFRDVAPLLGSVDFVFANLESPFSSSLDFSRSSANIFNAPPAHVLGLVEHRFRIVNLANNHTLDQGVQGLRFTLQHLADHGIAAVGAGSDQAQAWRPAIVAVRGIRIGFVGASYASVNDDGTSRSPYVARIDDDRRLGGAIASARAGADVVVVTMHAGSEYNPQVHPSQVRFAHRAIDLGADVVFGAHPHVLQRIERYRGRYVFYSLGNFIFDHLRPGTRDGLAVRTTVGLGRTADGERRGSVQGLELVPVVIEERCAPRPAPEAAAARILAAVGATERVLPVAPLAPLEQVRPGGRAGRGMTAAE